MENNTKYIIIYDHADPKQELSFDDLKNVLQFLEESDVMSIAFPEKPEKAVPDFDAFAEKLAALTDQAEEYRDLLNSFITEADALLEEIDALTDGADEDE